MAMFNRAVICDMPKRLTTGTSQLSTGSVRIDRNENVF